MCRHRELSSRGVSRQEGNPTIIKGSDTRAMQSLLGTPPAQQHCLHQASCPAQWHQDVPKCSSLTTSALVRSPNSVTAPHSSAAKPQPLLHSWHSIPGDKGHRIGCCRHHGEQGWLWRRGWKASTRQAKWLWMGAGDTVEGNKQEPS